MVKEQFKETDAAKKISHITFGMLSSSEMRQQAHIQVITPQLYDNSTAQKPIPYGLLDTKLGTTNRDMRCETCGNKVTDCVGHFGFIDLELPVFHIGYFRSIIYVLQSICKTCSRVLLNADQRKSYARSIADPELSYLRKKSLRTQITKKCQKVSRCPYCGDFNGTVKKFGFLKILHEKYRHSKKAADEGLEVFKRSFQDAMEHNRDIEGLINKIQEVLNPLKVLEIFKNIPSEDISYLLMCSDNARPVDMILQRILVPPACIRPTVVSRTGTTEDDVTMRLRTIMSTNNVIAHAIESSTLDNFLLEWEHLQLEVALLYNSETTSGVPIYLQERLKDVRSRGIVQRLKGKKGRFRGNLSGKRVEYSSRSVISPDPNLNIDQVGVPLHVAKILTYPEKVTKINLNLMKKLVGNGATKHPGANYVIKRDKQQFSLLYDTRTQVKLLQVGDVVERHLMDGDIVLFNRQPSLHRLSIQAFYAKVLPHRTFRFNECCCNPFNADFDGDEMNLHLPQTEEARAEALVLMGSKSNMVTPRNGEPLIAAIQDFITGSYLLTQKDVFFDRTRASQIASSILAHDDTSMRIDLPPPAILKPVQLWTGKQIFSLILRPNKDCPVKVNLRCRCKQYTSNYELCNRDAYLVVHNSELLAGTMEKSHLGSGSKNNIFYLILRDYGEKQSAQSLSRLARLTSAFIMNRGFSIGIGDVTPGLGLLAGKKKLLEEGYAKCNDVIRELAEGRLQFLPGCDGEKTLETILLKELSTLRESAADICFKELHKTNSPLIMAVCGSKGSNINISQMIACVGQQSISGNRVPNGFEDRALPHFARHAKEPEARGFVENSFYSGLTPTEFFFHTMGGREGLVDTAVKTAETGYLQRRLMKALEDLCCNYDWTVRNSLGEIVQFSYGVDGLDPSAMEGSGMPVDFSRLLHHIRCSYPCGNEDALTSAELKSYIEHQLNSEQFCRCDDAFLYELREFLSKTVSEVEKTRSRYSLDSATQSTPRVLYELNRVTVTQITQFFSVCLDKYLRAKIEPGTAVGALASQSIGEPATQMTLKTFHFAGVASMNITQGVPRLEEIINASPNIKTPMIVCQLDESHRFSADAARRVKGRIERTYLGEVAECFQEVLVPHDYFIIVKLDTFRIKVLKLEVTAYSIRDSILNSDLRKKVKQLKSVAVEVYGNSALYVIPRTDEQKCSAYSLLEDLKAALPSVVIKGLPTVSRAVIQMSDSSTSPSYSLFIEGTHLLGVLGTYGVYSGSFSDKAETTSNSTHEVARTLGIEAARTTIMLEIEKVMQGHSISVDKRHVMLLADVMTFTGEVLGINRGGMAKMRESALMLASFEKTAEHIFEAGYHGQKDAIRGVSECIIMGVPMSLGTGLFKLLRRTESDSVFRRRPLLFDTREFHLPSPMTT